MDLNIPLLSNLGDLELPLLPSLEDFEDENITSDIPISTNQDIPIVQKLKYCYYNRIPFEVREGVKSIYCSTERIPFSKKISKEMKDWYESENMHPYSSGEFSVPKDFKQFVFLDQVIFNESCTSFRVDRYKHNFKNEIEKEEHALAVEYFMQKYYHGSDEEAEDIAKKYRLQKSQPINLSIEVDEEKKHIDRDLGLEAPSGCVIIDNATSIGLKLNTYKGYIDSLENGLYDKLGDEAINYGVEFKVVHDYYNSWDFSCIDPYNEAIKSLKNHFEIIDGYKKNMSVKTLDALKESLKKRANKLLNHYMGKIKISEKDEISVIQMVEDFFETQGITAETILLKPIVLPKKYQGYYYNGSETI